MTLTSAIARKTGITTEPVAIVWTDEKPPGALEFKEGAWGCVMWLFAKVALEGRTAVFGRETIGCAGAAMGLGFGRPFEQHSSRNEEGFCCFLSNGIAGAKNRSDYEAIVQQSRDPRHAKMLTEGERLMKDPAVVKKFLETLPRYDSDKKFILMKPLSEICSGEDVRSVTFVADADQISALSIMVNYNTGRIMDGVIVASGASGCQAIGVCTYADGTTPAPRAVVGLTDITARKAVRRLLGRDKLTFSVPYDLYLEMEGNVPGSFLESDLWRQLRDSD